MPPRYSTIFAATDACRQSLEACLTVPYLMENEWAENRLADFNMWSDGAGASAGGRASLDSRLESEPKIKIVIINLLRMLITLVEKCYSTAQDMAKTCPLKLVNLITTLPEDSGEALLVMHVEAPAGAPTRREDDAIADEREALKQNTREVKEILKEIVRLTAAIRKASSSSRFHKADGPFKIEDYKKLSEYLHFILTAYPSKDKTQALQRDPSNISTIQQRLIEANLKRRNRFLYQQKHSEKLAIREIPRTFLPRGRIVSLWYTAKKWILAFFQFLFPTTSTQASNSTLFRSQETPRSEQAPLSLTSASKVETITEIEKSKSPSTVVSSTVTRVDYPEPPQFEPEDIMFKCPCCCQYLPVDIAEQNSRWRKHLVEDIQPYTCILENCPTPLNLFDNRNMWMNHMRNEHKSRRYWSCPDTCCSSRDFFENEQDFKSHLQTNHSDLASENDLKLLISVYARSESIEIQSCPLCPSDFNSTDVDVALLLKHIAEHMHSFSMNSLPEEDTDDGYFSKNKYFNTSAKFESALSDLGTLSDRSSTGLESRDFYEDEQQQSVFSSRGPNDSETSSHNALDTPLHEPKQFTTSEAAAARFQSLLLEEHIEGQIGSLQFFLPRDKRADLITHPIVAEQGWFGASERIASVVGTTEKTCKDLFMILAYIGKAHEICAFIDENLSDTDLPFTYQATEDTLWRANGGEIKSVKHWPKSKRIELAKSQWCILTPQFSAQQHYEFHDNTIFPFTYEKLLSGGAYSDIYEAKIHPAHHNFGRLSDSTNDGLSVAIKKLRFHDEAEFIKERTILATLEAKRHDHLVKLLFSYEYKDNYHLVFLCAEGNLRGYWEQNSKPEFALPMVLWSLGQMIGITYALQVVHHFKATNPVPMTEIESPQGKPVMTMSVKPEEERFGRHGDLKPENILWFRNSGKDIFQISDFGLGRFHGRDTRTKAPPYVIKSSETYEPPECHIYLPVSRAYDMWSLGCLFLEWVSWMLKGWDAIDNFSQSRLENSFILNNEGKIKDDYFWTLIIGSDKRNTNKRDAKVRSGVEKWVRFLREDPNCSQLIQDLLSLLMNDLLCINPKDRSNAAQLRSNLRKLFERAENDHIYATKPCPLIDTPAPDVADGPAR